MASAIEASLKNIHNATYSANTGEINSAISEIIEQPLLNSSVTKQPLMINELIDKVMAKFTN